MLDEPFQMVQTHHKAAASVLRFAKARKQDCIKTASVPGDERKCDDEAFTLLFNLEKGLHADCGIHFTWNISNFETTSGLVLSMLMQAETSH